MMSAGACLPGNSCCKAVHVQEWQQGSAVDGCDTCAWWPGVMIRKRVCHSTSDCISKPHISCNLVDRTQHLFLLWGCLVQLHPLEDGGQASTLTGAAYSILQRCGAAAAGAAVAGGAAATTQGSSTRCECLYLLRYPIGALQGAAAANATIIA